MVRCTHFLKFQILNRSLGIAYFACVIGFRISLGHHEFFADYHSIALSIGSLIAFSISVVSPKCSLSKGWRASNLLCFIARVQAHVFYASRFYVWLPVTHNGLPHSQHPTRSPQHPLCQDFTPPASSERRGWTFNTNHFFARSAQSRNYFWCHFHCYTVILTA